MPCHKHDKWSLSKDVIYFIIIILVIFVCREVLSWYLKGNAILEKLRILLLRQKIMQKQLDTLMH